MPAARCTLKPAHGAVMTSATLTKDVDKAYSAGIDGYVIKPFDMDKFLQKVEKILKTA